MTRINIVDPSELYDQHLIAEYREIRLLTENLRRSFATKNGLDKNRIPKEYTLNTGHVLFFASRGKYISNRYQQIIEEMRRRGFEPQFLSIDESVWPPGFFNDWTPQEKDFAIVRERIAERVAAKPEWYRYYGKQKELTCYAL